MGENNRKIQPVNDRQGFHFMRAEQKGEEMDAVDDDLEVSTTEQLPMSTEDPDFEFDPSEVGDQMDSEVEEGDSVDEQDLNSQNNEGSLDELDPSIFNSTETEITENENENENELPDNEDPTMNNMDAGEADDGHGHDHSSSSVINLCSSSLILILVVQVIFM